MGERCELDEGERVEQLKQVAVPAGEERRRVNCWQRSVREMSSSVGLLLRRRRGDCEADVVAGGGIEQGRLEDLSVSGWTC